MTVTHTSTSDLGLHPALARMAKWEQDDPRFESLVEDIRDRGIDVPLIIDPKNRIVDGRHRFWAAKRLHLTSVPTRTVQPDQVAGIILSTILHRRHYTLGQRAYISYPFWEDGHIEANQRRTSGLRQGTHTGTTLHRTVAEFVSELGFSRDLFNQAARVHTIFAADPAYAALMEPRILDEHSPVGLGAVIAGYAGQKATAGKPKNDRGPGRQMELFTDGFISEIRHWSAYASADPSDKSEFIREVRKVAAELPPETCVGLAAHYKQLAREFDTAAKDRV